MNNEIWIHTQTRQLDLMKERLLAIMLPRLNNITITYMAMSKSVAAKLTKWKRKLLQYYI